MDQESLIRAIESSFEGTPKPHKLSVPTYDDEGTHHFFYGKDWGDLRAAELRLHEASLCFFTAEAFRYFLPAFMLAELREPVVADVIAEGIIFHLKDQVSGRDERQILHAMTTAERKAVAEFVRCIMNRYYPPSREERRSELDRLVEAIEAFEARPSVTVLPTGRKE